MKKSSAHIIAFLTSILVLLVASACLIACCSEKGNVKHQAKVRPIPRVRYDGIDVSHHQGTMDWAKLSKDTAIQFVYIKATEGTSWQDNLFKQNARKARQNGMKVGAYHLLSLVSSPETQVENFCKMVSPNEIDLIPAIDIEASLMHHKHRDRLLPYAIRVSELMKERFGRKPLIYTSKGVYDNYLSTHFTTHYLWISAYTKRCPLLRGEAHADIWQYSEKGKVQNCEKQLDLNCFVNGMTIDKLEL